MGDGGAGGGPPANVSVFAGRIADAGIDPIPIMEKALGVVSPHPNIEVIWASPARSSTSCRPTASAATSSP